MNCESDPTETPLSVLYVDEHLIAVAKPSGMFVHPSDADRSVKESVLKCVREQFNQYLYPVHRLDRATSGIVLLARSSIAASRMGTLFSGRCVKKTYRALVRGHCPATGTIDRPLMPPRGKGRPAGHPHTETQEAVTEFITLQRYEIPLQSDSYPVTWCSLIDASPLTGRFHQIRRHLNSVAHPIIGDTTHGDSRQNRFFGKEFRLTRLMLAAVRLEFPHPVTEARLQIESLPDQSFSGLIDQLSPFRC